MEYLYNDNDLEIIRFIKNNPPKRIWYEYLSYVFEYESFYFTIEIQDEKADSINDYDEAIIGKITKISNEFQSSEYYTLICENKRIEELYVVRTFLYFTPIKYLSKLTIFKNKIINKIKSFFTKRNDILQKLLAETIGGCEEITCHPNSEQAKKVQKEYSNLLDCGLLLNIEGKYLKVFVESNGYGFYILNEKYFFDLDEIKDIPQQFELIKI